MSICAFQSLLENSALNLFFIVISIIRHILPDSYIEVNWLGDMCCAIDTDVDDFFALYFPVEWTKEEVDFVCQVSKVLCLPRL